ncbi:MAG TPA: SDR family oxidoreductase [Chloroflexota bacterium]|jgi:3-oxoacyl-[acyl-carrier protein] reductase|nr:SDR family oxidoreductase [Chloroflexota bacterium]
MDLQLDGRIAIVTGASRGIGRSISLALAAEGVRLGLVARGEEGLEEVSREIGGEEPPLLLAGDLSAPNGPAEIVDAIVERFGGIDIVVNNAGASLGGDVSETTPDDLALSFRMNVEIPFMLSRHAIPHMRKQGFGRIVMLSSIYGREAGGKIPYNAAKAAEISLTKSLAREVAADGITVNNVAPGSVRYPGGSWDRRVKADPKGMKAWTSRELPLGRFGTAEEVASVVTFLCSPLASLINGSSLVVDGGQGRSNL